MKLRRVAAIARKSLGQFRHDKRTLGFVVAMPLIMVFAFGYTFGGEVHHVRVLVVNDDAGPLAASLLRNVTGDTLDLVSYSDEDAAREEVRTGEAWAALLFPENFTQDLISPLAGGSIEVVLDGSSPTIVAAILGKLRAAAEETFVAVGGEAALSLSQDYVYGSADTRFIDFFAPGIVALAVLMVTTVLSVIIIVREKAGGMLERLFATPMRASEFVAGHALSLAVLALFQSAVVLGATLLIFQVQVVGSIALAFGVLLLFAVGNQGLGMMLSAAAKNELQAIQTIPLILFPSLLLTGIFYPIEAIPPEFQPLSFAVPLTYAADAMKSVFLRGWGLAEVGLDVLILAVYAVLTLLAATYFVRRQA
jgi:ABC-2 type transport system permease protein